MRVPTLGCGVLDRGLKSLSRNRGIILIKIDFDLSPLIVWIALWIVNILSHDSKAFCMMVQYNHCGSDITSTCSRRWAETFDPVKADIEKNREQNQLIYHPWLYRSWLKHFPKSHKE